MSASGDFFDERYERVGIGPRTAAGAAHRLTADPFLGERLEDLGRFVAHDVFALGHRADQAPKDRQTTQCQVRTAVVDPDLRVEF